MKRNFNFFGGISIGSLVAFGISWYNNHDLMWAIFHAVCNWFYVIYFVLTKYNF